MTDTTEDVAVSLVDMLGPAAIASPVADIYLSHLTSLPLSTLLSEPAGLQTQAHHLTSSLTSLTHTSYPTFLSLHSTTKSLTDAITSFSASLESLINISLPALEESAAGWKSRTEDVLSERRKARVVLDQQEKLRDLLDIPVLIDTCVRNGYFAEALSLAAHAKSLAISSTSPPLIITSVQAEVQNSISHMLLSLLATLHEPGRKLPALYKSVNFLRKMEAFEKDSRVDPEEQVALAFLTARESCLKSSLDGTERDIMRLVGSGDLTDRDAEDVTKYLKRYIDMWREGVNDIVNQFSTIFLERSTSSLKDKPSLPEPDVPYDSLHQMISVYGTYSLQTHLLPLLSNTLIHIPLQSLPSLLTQLTYCAHAFGRVGLDFRGSLAGLFSNVVFAGVSAQFKTATAIWCDLLMDKKGSSTLLSPTISSNNHKISLTPPSKFMIASSAIQTPPRPSHIVPASPSVSSQVQSYIPPQILSSYPPLTGYTNALLTTLNNLRLLAPVDIQDELQSALDSCLQESGDTLLAYIRRLFDSSDVTQLNDHERSQEEKIACAIGEVYFSVFVPFIRRAIGQGVYGVEKDYNITPSGDSTNNTKIGNGFVPTTRDLKFVVQDWEGWLASIKAR